MSNDLWNHLNAKTFTFFPDGKVSQKIPSEFSLLQGEKVVFLPLPSIQCNPLKHQTLLLPFPSPPPSLIGDRNLQCYVHPPNIWHHL